MVTRHLGRDLPSPQVRSARRNSELNGLGPQVAVLQVGPSLNDPEPLEQVGKLLQLSRFLPRAREKQKD